MSRYKTYSNMNFRILVLNAFSGCVIIGLTSCEKSSSRGQGSESDGVQQVKSRVQLVHELKAKRDSGGTAEGAEILESLHALDTDEFDKRLRDYDKIKVWLAKIDTEIIESLLTQSGFDEKEERWQQLFNIYCMGKAEIDPKAYVDWLTGDKKDKIQTMVSFLARCNPEMAAEVVTHSALDEPGKSASYGQVFEAASAMDPERSVQAMESTAFESPSLKNRAMIAVISGVNRETVTPPVMARIMAGFSEDSLNSFPQAVRQAGGAVVENPVANVLAVFPLDEKPWERVVAISFLETKAYRGVTGDAEIMEFLESKKANLLTENERDRLYSILGK